MRWEGHCRQMSLAVWGALAVFRPHWVCPRSRRVCFPHLHCSGSRLLYREPALSCVHFPGLSHSGSGSWVFHKSTDSVGPVFFAFPRRSSSGSQELDERTLPNAVRLIPSTVPASVSMCAGPVRLVSLLGSRSLAATILLDVNHPESQEIFG